MRFQLRMPRQGTNLQLEHVFSCELDDRKRGVLIKEHRPRHCFADVAVFHHGKGHCFVTDTEVKIDQASLGIDILFSGPVCTNLSRLNNSRTDFAGSYENDTDENAGISSVTYKFGFRQAHCWEVVCGLYTPQNLCVLWESWWF